MAFIGGILPQRSWQLGFDWCEVRLSNWGLYDANDLYTMEFPQLPAEYFPPLAGIAIAPSSHVSKAIIWCNDGVTRPVDVDYAPPVPPVGGHDYRQDYTGTSQFIVTNERPWLNSINTSNGETYFGSESGASTAPQLRRIKIICHPDTRWYNTYVPDGSDPASPSPFGTALNTGPGNYSIYDHDPAFIAPELHLTLFFRKAPIVSLRREPFYHIGRLSPYLWSDTSTDHLVRVFPVGGRKKFRLSLSPTFIGPQFGQKRSVFNVRIMAVKQGIGATWGQYIDPLFRWLSTNNSTETQIGQVTSFSATRGVGFPAPLPTVLQQTTITGDLEDYSFLLVYVQDTLASIGTSAYLNYQFSAWDE